MRMDVAQALILRYIATLNRKQVKIHDPGLKNLRVKSPLCAKFGNSNIRLPSESRITNPLSFLPFGRVYTSSFFNERSNSLTSDVKLQPRSTAPGP